MTKVCKNCEQEKDISEFYFCPSHKKYYVHCKACSSILTARWRINFKDKYNESKRKLMKDPQHKAAHNGRVALRSIIRNLRTGHKFLNICKAYTREKLMSHLIKTIPTGYKIEDYGRALCVDHIKPCIMFDLTDPKQFAKCFNYKNLRLVTKSENLTKGSKYDKPKKGKSNESVTVS